MGLWETNIRTEGTLISITRKVWFVQRKSNSGPRRYPPKAFSMLIPLTPYHVSLIRINLLKVSKWEYIGSRSKTDTQVLVQVPQLF